MAKSKHHKPYNESNVHKEFLNGELEELKMYRSFCSSIYAVIYIIQLDPYKLLWINNNPLVKQITGMKAKEVMAKGDTMAANLIDSPDFEESVVDVVKKFKKDPDIKWAGLYRIKDKKGKYHWIIYTASTMTKDENGNALTASIIAFPLDEIFNTPNTLKEFQKHLQLNINKPERERLSDKQKRIMRYMAEGLSRKEIAHRMNISIYTLDDHKRALKKKFNLETTYELVRTAQSLGLMINEMI